MILRRILVFIAAYLTFVIFVYLPVCVVQAGIHHWRGYMSPKENPDVIQSLAGAIGIADVVKKERLFYLDGRPIYGETDNSGYSVAVVDYDEAMSFKAKSKHFTWNETIKAHDKDQKLVLVHILMANDSDKDGMDTAAGQFYLERKGKSYPYDVIAVQTLKDCGLYNGKEDIPPGETTLIVVPFGVDQEEDVENLNLVYFPSIFTPTVSLPLRGKRL